VTSTAVPTRTLLILLVSALVVQRADAQSLVAGVDLLFYGDNTEFANPFRQGETLLGTAGRVFVDVQLSDAATLRAGIFAKGRYGAREFVEEAEPVIALELKRGGSRFLFGSLDTAATRTRRRGPDEDTPHGLLPPLQREQLTFTRAHEMGLQWLRETPRVDHDSWINWQRLNTSAHRERFDAGARSRLALPHALALHAQWHVVHEGGQQFANGAVRDSHAAAVGLEWARAIGRTRLVLDGYGVATRDVPDREEPQRGENGGGLFARGALERADWRAHVIVWRSRDTSKEEGDPNYLMWRRNGTKFRKVRDYGELGLTRHFRPAPTVQFDAAVRLHRVESHYEYSYRLVGRVFLRYRR
jgi:hypothetical protein